MKKLTEFCIGHIDHWIHEFRISEEILEEDEEIQQEDPAPVMETMVHTGNFYSRHRK